MADTQEIYSYQMPPEYVQTRMQELLNTLFGVPAQGVEGEEGYVPAVKGLLETPVPVVGQQVAGFTPDQLQAFQLARSGIGSYLPYLQGATAATSGALGAIPGLQGAAQMAGQAGQATTPLDLSQAYSATGAGMGQYRPTQEVIKEYMDPYQKSVTDEALKEIRRQANMAAGQQSAQAVGAGAFGGGREGVVRAETERGVQDIMSRRIFEDLSRNYQTALGASQAAQEAASRRALQAGQQFGQLGLGEAGVRQSDLARQLSAAGLMGSLAGQEAEIGLGVGKQLGALGTTAQAQQLQDIQSLLGVGGMQQQLGQATLEAQRQNLMQQYMEPYRRYSFGLEALGGLPFGGTSIQQQTVPTANPFLQALSSIGTFGVGIGSLGGFGRG